MEKEMGMEKEEMENGEEEEAVEEGSAVALHQLW